MNKTKMRTRLIGQVASNIPSKLPKPLCSLSPSVVAFAVANKAGLQGYSFKSDTKL